METDHPVNVWLGHRLFSSSGRKHFTTYAPKVKETVTSFVEQIIIGYDVITLRKYFKFLSAQTIPTNLLYL